MNLQNKFKIDDNKVEIKTKVKRLIEQQEGKRKKNNNIITDKKNINITT